jgi:hypothetical protein
MTLDSWALISDLLELEEQIRQAPRHVEALRVALEMATGNAAAMARRAHLQAGGHLRALVETTHRIKSRVVPEDGLGMTLGSISELVLRGQRRIVLIEVEALRDLASKPTSHDRMQSLAVGPFDEFADWLSYVAHEVNGCNQGWIDYREHEAEEREAYRDALRSAHTAMRTLREDSKATPLLCDAVAAIGWPGLQAPCARIAAALSIQIDVDPDQPLLVFPMARSEPLAERLT